MEPDDPLSNIICAQWSYVPQYAADLAVSLDELIFIQAPEPACRPYETLKQRQVHSRLARALKQVDPVNIGRIVVGMLAGKGREPPTYTL
jgi:hypothetical protein